MSLFRRGLLLCLLLVATAGCDRVTKHLAVTTLAGGAGYSYLGDTVRLDYHENKGGFLAMGASWQPTTRAAVFQIANGIFLMGIMVMALRFRWSRLAKAGLVMFVAGGLSNLIDRVAMGSVIDFLNVGIGPVRTGIFNIADVAIWPASPSWLSTAGAATLLWRRTFRFVLHVKIFPLTRQPGQILLDRTDAPLESDSTVLAYEMHYGRAWSFWAALPPWSG